MNNPIRVFFFKYFSLIISLLSAVACLAIYLGDRNGIAPNALITIVGSALTITFLVQKQRNEELQAFQQLFMKFNERYSDIHPAMQRVINASADSVSVETFQTLESYFNLCAEEYLFFCEGKILPRVWRAWCTGMVEYLKHDRIRSYWERQQGINSHYGLTSAAITAGSGMTPPH